MGIRLIVNNFRCLRNVDWDPDGVCLLVGPNGSGKTTLFDALNFLRLALKLDVSQAVAASGGTYFRNLDAPPEEPVSFALAQGNLKWEFFISFGAGPSNLSVTDRLVDSSDGGVITSRLPQHKATLPLNDPKTGEPRTLLWYYGNLSDCPPWIKPFISFVEDLKVYGNYSLQQLCHGGSPVSADMQLDPSGVNAFTVLRNWQGRRDFRTRYEFVVKQLRKAFPGISDDLEFDFDG